MIRFFRAKLLARHIFLSFTSGLLAITLFSCEKGDRDAGLDVLPGNENIKVKYFDSLQLEAYSMEANTLNGYGQSYQSIGRYVSPIFGESAASFVTVFKEITKLEKVTLTIDTVFLYLSPYKCFPDTSGQLRLEAFPLTRVLKGGYTYPSFDISNHFEEGTSVISSEVVDISQIQKKCKIRLTEEFGRKLLTDTNFVFNGLYIRALDVADNQFVMAVELSDTMRTKIVIHYTKFITDTNNIVTDTIVSKQVIHPEASSLTLASHQHPLQLPIYSPDVPYSGMQEDVYIQGMAGLMTQVTFNGLMQWLKTKHLSINKAELELPIRNYNSADTATYPIGAYLSENPSMVPILAYRSDSVYKADFSNYVLQLSTKTDTVDRKIYIYDAFYSKTDEGDTYFGSPNITIPTGVVIANTPEKRVRLKITYTEY